MVNSHAEIGRLGCDTILDNTQTNLTTSAMLESSLALCPSMDDMVAGQRSFK